MSCSIWMTGRTHIELSYLSDLACSGFQITSIGSWIEKVVHCWCNYYFVFFPNQPTFLELLQFRQLPKSKVQ